MNKQLEKKIGKGLRPVFVPCKNKAGVKEVEIAFNWHMGMSAQVRQRSIKSLHEKAFIEGYKNVLEASSKSDNQIGIDLSAFFLRNDKNIPVENLFQGSKVFSNGGAFLDLISTAVTPREAKKDKRLKESGELIEFNFNGIRFSLEPKSIFYDWLYMSVLEQSHNIEKKRRLINANFDAFSDIEFNPKKSFNCQARTLALYVSLHNNNRIEEFLNSPEKINKELGLYFTQENKGQQKLF